MERPDGLNRPRLLWLSAERLRIGREMNGDLEALLEFVAAISPYTKALESRLEKLEEAFKWAQILLIHYEVMTKDAERTPLTPITEGTIQEYKKALAAVEE